MKVLVRQKNAHYEVDIPPRLILGAIALMIYVFNGQEAVTPLVSILRAALVGS